MGEKVHSGSQVLEVVGIVENARYRTPLGGDNAAVLYVQNRAITDVGHLVIRFSGKHETLLPLVRSTLRDVDPYIVVTSTNTLSEIVASALVYQRFRAVVSVVFGIVALCIAGVGIYSVVSRWVSDREKELGIRIALGARFDDVARLLLAQTLRVMCYGFAAGIPIAYAASQWSRSLLHGPFTDGPLVILAAAALIVSCGVCGTLIPLRQAKRIDPMRALQQTL